MGSCLSGDRRDRGGEAVGGGSNNERGSHHHQRSDENTVRTTGPQYDLACRKGYIVDIRVPSASSSKVAS